MKSLKDILVKFLLLALPLCVKADNYADINAKYQKASALLQSEKYEEAKVAIEQIILQLPTSQRANAYSDLAVCQKNLGLISQADNSFKLAIKTSYNGLNREKILLNYSNFLVEIGDYVNAINILENVSKEYLIPHKLINLANARYYKDDGNISAAISLLDSCLTIGVTSSDLRQIALQNKAFYLMGSYEYNEALQCFKQVINNYKEKKTYYQCLGNIALANAHIGNYIEAENDILSVCRWFKNKYQDDYIISLRKAGEVYYIADNIAKSKLYFHAFFRKEKQAIIDVLPSLSKEMKLNIWMKEKPLLSKCFMLEDNDAEFLYNVAMFRRQISLLGMHNTVDLRTSLSITASDIKKRLKNNEVAIEFVSYNDINGKENYAAIVLTAKGKARFLKLFATDDIYSTHVGLYSIYDAIKTENAEAKNLLYNSIEIGNSIWKPIISSLPSNITKIYFAPEGLMHFIGIENLNFDGRNRYEIHRLSTTSLLLKRGEKRGIGNMLVIGGLDYSTIPNDSTKLKPNLEASALLGQKFGTVNLFRYLPGSRAEADSIGSKIKSIVVHEMGEGQLKDIISSYSTVHIATHGYSLDLGFRKRPQYMADSVAIDISLVGSGLAMTGANIESNLVNHDDGLLSAREICDLDLQDVDFVILSACQTAQGDITDEGAAGMVRGLKIAGVKTIIATLWSVDDASTSCFMQKFYELLSTGYTKTESFMKAQEYLRNEKINLPYYKFDVATMAKSKKTSYYKRDFSDPYYWAPFILIDDY
jgi:CHAT domain-containing protein/tetratricopeptide (TPR) repeat protein